MIPKEVTPFDPATFTPEDYDHAGAAALIVASDGGLLLQRRTPPYKRAGQVNCFGGGMEAGETPLVTVIRELHEEVGVAIDPAELTFIAATTRLSRHMTRRAVTAYFLWHDKDGQVAEAYEGELVRFADAGALLACDRLSFSTRWIVEKCLSSGLIPDLRKSA